MNNCSLSPLPNTAMTGSWLQQTTVKQNQITDTKIPTCVPEIGSFSRWENNNNDNKARLNFHHHSFRLEKIRFKCFGMGNGSREACALLNTLRLLSHC